MKKVFKYVLRPKIYIDLPLGSEVLSAIFQDREIVLYALVDTEIADKEIRTFKVFGTGHEISDENLLFISTVKIDKDLIFHVFEIFE